MPFSIINIGTGAFNSCYSLTNIVVDPNNSVYDSRDNCNAIIQTDTNTLYFGSNSTVIPNSVTEINGNAFYYRTGLTSITIPNSVRNIGSEAFYGCTSLVSVTVNRESPPALASYTFIYNGTGRKIYVPSNSLNLYKSTSGWSVYSSSIEAIPTE